MHMAAFRNSKLAALITQLLRKREIVPALKFDRGLPVVAALRLKEHWAQAHSVSTHGHRGRADGEGARIVGSDSDIEPYEDQEAIARQDSEAEDRRFNNDGNWSKQLSWFSNIVEPALHKYRTPHPEELAESYDGSASARSLLDIAASLVKSTAGMQQWGLADITFGLYLLSLRHTTEMAVDAFHGQQVTCDHMVQRWIHHLELAWGAYMKNPAALARVSMLREKNVVKFVGKASVMRPAYYIGVDTRHKLVVMSIRGTSTLHDLVTDLATHNENSGILDGEPVHYGSFEAAQWLQRHEAATLRRCLEENKGFELLLVGHSLGGATAALLGMLLRQDSEKVLGLYPEKIRVVGIGTPPCLSKVLAARCRDFTTTLVLQDDVIPRMSTTALLQLRNEILLLEWNDVLKGEFENKGLVDLVSSTVQALSSVQDAARKYGAIARRTINLNGPDDNAENDAKIEAREKNELEKHKLELIESAKTAPHEHPHLHAPGTLYHIRSRSLKPAELSGKETDYGCSLWKGDSDAKLGRIVLSTSMLSDHRCESYYYALRDVLKGIPISERLTTGM
ncbi:sn1-specific diacylglycerol lipase [Marchantia polymorpha subsp. ruderalis]|uniref:Fungal lipase-type domain-containing protein n=2 Tax=Marchantia polymorpha TaxID=3197 RepID=A0AAF6AWD4_MARPO|nr:hypothetical protein MARPO_0007s0153 [Marchantia polymorpha]BBN04068.1 hypothetical protein Mp_3g01610 [Marchantia polymorpha subsp. ruderalis]|eukprot:PTQ47755.1 hypothetical protein MARPO_0007s0153 [Marchantia polymorpha]